MDKKNLGCLTTEANNRATCHIDTVDTREMVRLMNRQDKDVAKAVEKELPLVAQAIDLISIGLKNGGRLLYFGAGTSGRLGVLDASECIPTFGLSTETVQGFIAGGYRALRQPVAEAEDSFKEGEQLVESLHITKDDTIVGITASGCTPYVLGAIIRANYFGAVTIGICNNPNSELKKFANMMITPIVGPEVIQGSTRLKAGTSQKLVLNMLSTGSMIKIGKVYKNYMVDMKPSNDKLRDRAVRLVCDTTEVDYKTALQTLEQCQFHIKSAIIMLLLSCDQQKAIALLESSDGYVAKALASNG
ncbi:MAG: N-acetylmuramic acid 6-phosphate etherase [Epulopiscium sp. Nele67-Bin005]|nr:MAG: N-acetylmuramic acid 6-phosphate etherase [Epulopiscium sp. Nele67-Bin005]